MALLVGGEVEAAERAYDWVPTMQRADGSWPMKIVGGEVEDARGEVNMSAYLAVGVWHHWLVRRDRAFVDRLWPVRARRAGLGGRAAAAVRRHPLDAEAEPRSALLAGSSSIYQSLRAGVALAELLGDPQPEWELAGGRLGHAVRHHRDLFAGQVDVLDGLVLPGPRRRRAGRGRPGAARVALGRLRGARARHPLRRHQPVGHRRRDLRAGDGPRRGRRPAPRPRAVRGHAAPARRRRLLLDRLGLRRRRADREPRDVHWPDEQTTYTAAAVVLLAADALDGDLRHATAGPGSCAATRWRRIPRARAGVRLPLSRRSRPP